MSDDKTEAQRRALEIVRERTNAKYSVGLGSDAVVSQYQPEIQEIYRTIYSKLYGYAPEQKIWVSDNVVLGVALEHENGAYTEESLRAISEAGVELGIIVNPSTRWEDAAQLLRSVRALIAS